MKEISIFIFIVILAVIFFIFIEGATSGANISEALRSYFKIEGMGTKSDFEETNSLEDKTKKSATTLPKKDVPKSENKEIEDKSEKNIEQTDQKEEKNIVSPYFEKIKIYSIQRSSNSSSPKSIKLYYYHFDEEINITGFKIKTRHGEFIIPKGIEKYESYQMERDIIIGKNIYIDIIEGQSPLGKNINFRTNKCLGYLNNFYSYNCPKPKKEDIAYLHPYCQDFILRLRTCEVPDYSNNSQISSNFNCTNYLIKNLNYPGCFKNYNQDNDFLGNNWYVYSNSNIIEPLHDIVYLFDRNNLLVHQYSY